MRKLNEILILLFMVCCISCNTKHDISFNQNLIKSISEEDENLPSRFFNSLFFCKCQNEEILILSVYELREVYLKEYKHTNYKDFLTELFNQKLLVNCNIQDKQIRINEEVKKNYLKMPLKEFLNLYCTKKKENIFIIKNNMPDESKNTILYFLFINNYITNIDDYSGTYVIKKVS